MAREKYEKAGENEEKLEYERTHPGWLQDVPAAPPEVTASQYEHTRPEEAGHLPDEERGAERK